MAPQNIWDILYHGNVRGVSRVDRLIVTESREKEGTLHIFDVVDGREFFHIRSEVIKPTETMDNKVRAMIRQTVAARIHTPGGDTPPIIH